MHAPHAAFVHLPMPIVAGGDNGLWTIKKGQHFTFGTWAVCIGYSRVEPHHNDDSVELCNIQKLTLVLHLHRYRNLFYALCVLAYRHHPLIICNISSASDSIAIIKFVQKHFSIIACVCVCVCVCLYWR